MPRTSDGRPTLRQVAAEAGVSTATVSNVINGTGRLSEPTRLRVIAAARRLSYQPTNSLRALSHGGTGVLGLTMTTFGDRAVAYTEIPYYADLVLGAIGAANDRGYLLQVMPSSISPWLWMTAPLDGVIHSEPRAKDPVREILLQRGIPMVSAGRPLKAGRLDAWVDSDHTVAIELLMQRFRDAGAHRVGYLMPDHDDAYPQLVLDAFLGWCERAEIEPRVGQFALADDYVRSERAAANKLLTSDSPPDALFGIYTDSGHNILAAAREQSCRVPGDLLVGCISEDPAYETTDPPVTTVSLQPRVAGTEAVDLLVALMNGRNGVERRRIVTPVLRARASTRG